MGRKVEINYSKVKEISDLGLSIKETLERLHECNINISRMQYYRWKQNNVTSNTSNAKNKLQNKCDYVTSSNNVTSNTSNANTKLQKKCNNVTSSKKENCVTNNNVTSKGRYEVVGLGFDNRTELKGKLFATVDEITSIGIDEIFIYDYELGRCLSREYVEKAKPFIPSTWR